MNSSDYHIFFVDDEPQVCKAVSRILSRQGYKVSCYGSAEECLEVFEQQKAHLLITDVNMKGLSGIDLLVKVKKMQPSLPVLIVTGYGDIPMAIRAIRCGAEEFIEKPLNSETLLPTIQNLLCEPLDVEKIKGTLLTPTEISVLRQILEGKSNREIAEHFHRATRTIEDHRKHIMQKLGVQNLVELVKVSMKIDFSQWNE